MKRKILFLFMVIILSSSALAQTSFQAENSLKKIRNAHNFLENKGLGDERFTDVREEAELAYRQRDYERVLNLEQEMIHLRNLSLFLQERIPVINASLAVFEEGTHPELFSLVESAIEAFSGSNYERAQAMVEKVDARLVEFSDENFSRILLRINQSRRIILELDASLSSPSLIEEEARRAKEGQNHVLLSELAVSSTKLQDGLTSLKNASLSVQEMVEKGLTTTRVEDAISEALFALEQEEYDHALSQIKEVHRLKEDALLLQKRIKNMTDIIRDASLDSLPTEGSEILVKGAKEKLFLNNYGDGFALLEEAQKKLEDARADALLFGVISKSDVKFNIIAFLKKTWWIFLAIIISLGVAGFFAFNSLMVTLLNYRIQHLEKENEVITGLIKKRQIEYYKEHKISKDSYETAVDGYQQRLLRIRGLLPVLQDKLAKHRDKKVNTVKKD